MCFCFFIFLHVPILALIKLLAMLKTDKILQQKHTYIQTENALISAISLIIFWFPAVYMYVIICICSYSLLFLEVLCLLLLCSLISACSRCAADVALFADCLHYFVHGHMSALLTHTRTCYLSLSPTLSHLLSVFAFVFLLWVSVWMCVCVCVVYLF